MGFAFFMDPENKKMVQALQDESAHALIIGNDVIYPPLQVGGKPYHFNAVQNRFLYALQMYKGNIPKACEFVQKDEEWGTKFIGSRKFREFRNAKIAMMAVRNGDLVDWWWEYGTAGATGYREWSEAYCGLCKEKNVYRQTEVEMARADDMTLHISCKVCLQPIDAVDVQLKKEEFKPTREQVQFWSEIGNRVSPKIERVHHEFSAEKFVFVTEGQ